MSVVGVLSWAGAEPATSTSVPRSATTKRIMRATSEGIESDDIIESRRDICRLLAGGPDDRRVDHVLEQPAIRHAVLGRLHHEHHEEVLARIHPEIRATGAAPAVLAHRAGERRHP